MHRLAASQFASPKPPAAAAPPPRAVPWLRGSALQSVTQWRQGLVLHPLSSAPRAYGPGGLDVLGSDRERIFRPRDADQFVASVEQRQSNVEDALRAISIAILNFEPSRDAAKLQRTLERSLLANHANSKIIAQPRSGTTAASGAASPISVAVARRYRRTSSERFGHGTAKLKPPARYRWLSLSPRRARPPATTRAIQLTHIGIGQSPMMTDQSITILARWNSATTAKITPATRENVFASMSHYPKVLTQDALKGAAAANVERTKCSPVWGRTGDHGPESNGTHRHVRPVFTIQINTCRGRTK